MSDWAVLWRLSGLLTRADSLKRSEHRSPLDFADLAA